MLIDSSAWIEYLRGTGSATNVAVRELIVREAHITTCEPVVMEVLAGGRTEAGVVELRRLLALPERLRITSSDWEDASRIYRAGRLRGVTIRRLLDCLIAAIALRAGEPVLHNDRDFDAIAQIVPLVAVRD